MFGPFAKNLICWCLNPVRPIEKLENLRAVIGLLEVYGNTSIFSRQFSKGDNFRDFLFAYLEDDRNKFFPL